MKNSSQKQPTTLVSYFKINILIAKVTSKSNSRLYPTLVFELVVLITRSWNHSFIHVRKSRAVFL